MKKLLIALTLLFSLQAQAATYQEFDITTGQGVYFSPGNNILYGMCDYSWGGLNVYRFEEFMQGATSYSTDKSYLGRCQNIEVDIIANRITIPYVNQTAFAEALEKPELNISRARTASTPMVGNIFSVKESELRNYIGWSLVSAGTYGSNNYFSCYIETKSLTYTWMEQAGFFSKELTPGYVYEITWFNRHIGGRDSKSCAGINVSLSPVLLLEPTPIVVDPVYCPVDCIPQP